MIGIHESLKSHPMELIRQSQLNRHTGRAITSPLKHGPSLSWIFSIFPMQNWQHINTLNSDLLHGTAQITPRPPRTHTHSPPPNFRLIAKILQISLKPTMQNFKVLQNTQKRPIIPISDSDLFHGIPHHPVKHEANI